MSPQVYTVAKAWMEAERLRFLDPTIHRELFDEVKWPGRGHDPSEGLDIRTLELTEKQQRLLGVLERVDSIELLSRWGVGRRLAEDTKKSLLASFGFITVCVSGSGKLEEYVWGGVAVQRMWLAATRLGMSLQPWNSLVGMAPSMTALTGVVGVSNAEMLHALGREALDAIGLKEETNDRFVLCFRVHSGPPPSSISDRRPWKIQ